MEKSSKQNIQKIQEGAELVFKLWFYLYVILSTCNLTYGTHIVSWCMWPMLVLGAVLVLARFIRIKDYIRMPLLWILILMFASYLFTMATNLQYESHKGLVTMVFWLFYFGLLYPVRTGDDTGRVKKEFTLMAVVHIGYALLMTLTSLGMMAVGYSSSYIDTNNGNYEVVSGFCYGRLWGTFQDPNLGAIVCCTAIALSIYFLMQTSRKWLKALLSLFILLFVVYIGFSDSRNGLLSLGIGMTAFVFFQLFYKERSWKKQWLHLAAALAVGIVCFLAPQGIKYSYNAVVSQAQQKEQQKTQEETVKKEKEAAVEKDAVQKDTAEKNTDTTKKAAVTPTPKPKKPAEKVERNYSMEGDISNRRFDIWKSAVEVALSRPITGTSFSGIVPYAKENLPETYIVNNDHWDYSTMDNEVLNVFVSQGFPGLIILIVLVVCAVKFVFSRIWKLGQKDFWRASVLLLCIVMLCVSAMFQATMFYQNSPDANMFWMFLGYLVFMLNKEVKAETK